MKRFLKKLLFIILIFGVFSKKEDRLSFAQEIQLSTQKYAIRNGSPYPRSLYLSTPQTQAIGWLYEDGNPLNRFCTATVISDNAIITAAHCFEDIDGYYEFPYGEVGFATGKANQSDQLENSWRFTESDLYIHRYLDVALITFPNRPFNDPSIIQPIRLNRTYLEDGLYYTLLNSFVDAVGYGRTFHSATESQRYFAAVQVKLISSRSIIISGNKEQGVCSGDSGGPLLAIDQYGQPALFAVLSKGDTCCVGADQLTRVDVVMEWIDQITQASFIRPNAPELELECWGVGVNGKCQAPDTLLLCEQGQVVSRSCGLGELCDLNPNTLRFECLNVEESCASLDWNGRCEGNKVIRCIRGQKYEEPCAEGHICQPLEVEETGGDFGRVGCVNPSDYIDELTVCTTDDDLELGEASQGRFIAVSSCVGSQDQPHSSSKYKMHILWLFSILLLIKAIRSKVAWS